MPIIKQNNKVDVRQNQDLVLSCTIAESKPAAEIKWYRGNVELKTNENRQDKIVKIIDPNVIVVPKPERDEDDDEEEEEEEEDGGNFRFNVTSSLTIKAAANDDLVDYKCRAKHLAISPDHPMQTVVQVSVLKPPGEPFIEGYSKSDKIRSGQEMELVCRSYGGNPPAQLIWYKNNRQVVSQYTTSGRDSASTYRFKVQSGDNKARLRCEASNTISDRPLNKEIDLTVLCKFIRIKMNLFAHTCECFFVVAVTHCPRQNYYHFIFCSFLSYLWENFSFSDDINRIFFSINLSISFKLLFTFLLLFQSL